MKFFEAFIRNKNTGLQQDYLLRAEGESYVANYLIKEGESYCGKGNFTYELNQTAKNNRKFKDI